MEDRVNKLLMQSRPLERLVKRVVKKALSEINKEEEEQEPLVQSVKDLEKDLSAAIKKNIVFRARLQKKSNEPNRVRDDRPYYGRKDIPSQLAILQKNFPSLNFGVSVPLEQRLPLDAENYFVIPRWQKVDPKSYTDALKKILELISNGDEKIFLSANLVYLEASDWEMSMIEQLPPEQSFEDFFIIAAQFGRYTKGRSVEEVCHALITNRDQFPLGGFTVASMLLTHPDRLNNSKSMWIDCPADRSAEGSTATAPYFHCEKTHEYSGVKMGAGCVSLRAHSAGSATGFI